MASGLTPDDIRKMMAQSWNAPGQVVKMGSISFGVNTLGTSNTANSSSNMAKKFKMYDEVSISGERAFFVCYDPDGDGSDDALIEFERIHAGNHGDKRVPKNYKQKGNWNFYRVSDVDDLRMVKPQVAEPPKVKKFDLTALNALVVADEVRSEMEAVLKQHRDGSKLFNDWGLGEVIEYGKGMTFMFYGGPGTGKTWAASCIAKVVGQDMVVIGAAEIQTSEPGGANRNIQNAFKEAKESGKVLFIDECDSLITSRNDLGMVLAGEVNTLLTEIEKSEGIVILATNRIANLDEALERRISLIVEFPEPNFDQRKLIWQKLLPKKMPLAKDVDVEKLAEYKLTGGQIKNCVLQAARLAMASEKKEVSKKEFVAAINRVQASKNLMGSASRYQQINVRTDVTKG